MNNIIFLDIDGVLTNDTQITKTMPKRHRIINKPILDLTDEVELALLDFDYKCINNLKEIANNTNSSIVITSSLKSTNIYPYIAEYLVNLGLPIIDRTETLNDKYQEISNYISKYRLENYIIIDDDYFLGCDEYADRFIYVQNEQIGLSKTETIKAINEINKNKDKRRRLKWNIT